VYEIVKSIRRHHSVPSEEVTHSVRARRGCRNRHSAADHTRLRLQVGIEIACKVHTVAIGGAGYELVNILNSNIVLFNSKQSGR